MEEKRTLIETFLPVEDISEEAKIEKLGNAKPPTSTLHYWWTRKPLIAARAAIIGSLLPEDYDVQDFKRLLGLGRERRAYTYDTNLEKMGILSDVTKKVWDDIPILLDPFAGGGSIPFEGLRAGIDVIANDYNPLSYLILKSTLDYPQKYGTEFFNDVNKGFQIVYDKTRNEIESYYPKYNGKEVCAYIWAWQVKCPHCGFENPLVGQWGLCRKKEKLYSIDYEKSGENEDIKFIIKQGKPTKSGNCTSGNGICLKCGSKIDNDIVVKDIKENQKEQLLAIVINGHKGKEYALPSDEDLEAVRKVQSLVIEQMEKWIVNDIVPNDDVPEDTRGSLSVRLYLPKWRDLLNARQLLLFITLEKNIKEYYREMLKTKDKEYVIAVSTYLSFIFGKHIAYNCRAITWHRTNEQIGQPSANRGVGMSWDHAEVNPFAKGSGTLSAMMQDILDGLQFAQLRLANSHKVTITNKSVTQLNNPVSLIICDPPYFDDVRYAEFSEFYYLWEQRVLKDIVNVGNIPSSEEISVGGWGRSPEFFSKLFDISIKKLYSNLSDNGILIIFFAHSSIKAWDFVINSLRKASFRITATWPIHTENTSNPLAQGHASIMSSIIIVARKRKEAKSGYLEEIHDELKNHLNNRLNEFWKYGLRGADLTVASMGASLDVITQYSDIKSYTGEMTIKDVLELVQESVTAYVLRNYMENVENLDAPTAFYLYARFSGLEYMPFDTANLIAKSMKIDLKVIEKQHLILSDKSAKSSGVKIQTFKDREDLYGKTIPMSSMINVIHYMMAAFSKGGYNDVLQVLSSVPYGRKEIHDILVAFQSLPPDDPERQIAKNILERMGENFPKSGQQSLDEY